MLGTCSYESTYTMLRKSLMLAAMATTIAAAPPAGKPAPAPALATAPATTINCLLASNTFAQRETDPKQKSLAEGVLYFYLGRVDPRSSPQQLKSALKQAGVSLRGVGAAPLMNACLREMETKAQLLQTIGQQLQQGK